MLIEFQVTVIEFQLTIMVGTPVQTRDLESMEGESLVKHTSAG